MTKFKVRPYSDYEQQKQLMDSIQKHMDDTLAKVDAETALRVLAQHKPIWTVDSPGVSGNFQLVSYNLISSKELFRRVGIPGEESSTNDIEFIEEANLLDLMQVQWFLEAQDYHDEMRKTRTAGEPGEGKDFIRIPNGHGVLKKVYPGSVIYVPTLEPGNRGNVFVVVKAIVDEDTIGCYLVNHSEGKKSKVEYTQVKRSAVKDEWRWHREPDVNDGEILGLDYIEMDGLRVREGMQVYVKGEFLKRNFEGDTFQVPDQWGDVVDLVSEEEALICILVKTEAGVLNAFVDIHGTYVYGIRDKAEKGEECKEEREG